MGDTASLVELLAALVTRALDTGVLEELLKE
jgi:hypothetical protein